jgi:hypothetical protein
MQQYFCETNNNKPNKCSNPATWGPVGGPPTRCYQCRRSDAPPDVKKKSAGICLHPGCKLHGSQTFDYGNKFPPMFCIEHGAPLGTESLKVVRTRHGIKKRKAPDSSDDDSSDDSLEISRIKKIAKTASDKAYDAYLDQHRVAKAEYTSKLQNYVDECKAKTNVLTLLIFRQKGEIENLKNTIKDSDPDDAISKLKRENEENKTTIRKLESDWSASDEQLCHRIDQQHSMIDRMGWDLAFYKQQHQYSEYAAESSK